MIVSKDRNEIKDIVDLGQYEVYLMLDAEAHNILI